MATMTKERIKDEFLDLLNDNYRYWTDTENSQESVLYLQGAFDLMSRCVETLDKAGEVIEVDECGEK